MKKSKITIVGAGMAGLIAGNVLRRFNPVILEKQWELPHNHEALLRFRTDAVSRATSIPFKKVKVVKGIYHNGQILNHCSPQMNNRYSMKVTSEILSRSISNLESEVRYIAPPDFIETMAQNLKIELGAEVGSFVEMNRPIISTLPMPVNLKIAGHTPEVKFGASEVMSISADIVGVKCDVYQTIYVVCEEIPIYRASITGRRLILEILPNDEIGESSEDWQLNNFMVHWCKEIFGFHPVELINLSLKKIQYGKITPIDEQYRKSVIYDLTTDHHVFSLGRFATWRQLLLDDVVDDAFAIEKIIQDPSSYTRRLHVANN